MSELLAYSMFSQVLFPKAAKLQGDATLHLRLRQLKRYTPSPEIQLSTTSVVLFDLETTGLDPETDRIIEIGAQKLCNFEVVEEFSTLVKPDVPLTDDIVRLTGIKPEMLVDQPTIEQAMPEFLRFIDTSLLVAHNAEFDLAMLRAACSRQDIDLEWPCFCTFKMSKELLPDLENRKLDTLAQHYGLTFESRHRSIGDVRVTTNVLRAMVQDAGDRIAKWSDLNSFTVV